MAKRDAVARKRRTREHIIASISRNYVERFILAKGHTSERRVNDYGIDLNVGTFDEDGYPEGGLVLIQLKATDQLVRWKRDECVWVNIEVGHYLGWIDEPMPVFLILYDAQQESAYWVHIQDYFAADPSQRPKRGAKTLRMYIPLANEFTGDTVDYMRAKKAEILAKDRRRRRRRG